MSPVHTMTDQDRAANGAALFDRKGLPDWFMRVTPSTLNVSSCSDCVCGQVYGWYSVGIDKLGITTAYSWEHGFSGASDALHEAWREQIMKRRLADLKRHSKDLELATV